MKKHKPCPHRLSTIGPEEEQQEVEAHHTVLFGDGDVVSVQNKVSFDFVLFSSSWCSFGGFVVYKKMVGAGLCAVTASSPQSSEASHFVLIAGEPIREPVFQHGALRCYFLLLTIIKYRSLNLNVIHGCNVSGFFFFFFILCYRPFRSICNDHRRRDPTGDQWPPVMQKRIWESQDLEVKDRRLILNAMGNIYLFVGVIIVWSLSLSSLCLSSLI